jgi:hypothetical protein
MSTWSYTQEALAVMNNNKRGLGSPYLRRRTWWIRYSVRGKRYRESSESENRADAVRLLKARITAIARGKPVGAQVERATLGDIAEILVADYIANARCSTKRARIALKRLFQFFDENARANTISSDRITAYKAHRQKLGAANATINHELAILRRAFTLALDAGKIASAPRVKMLHLDNVRQGFFRARSIRGGAQALAAASARADSCRLYHGMARTERTDAHVETR